MYVFMDVVLVTFAFDCIALAYCDWQIVTIELSEHEDKVGSQNDSKNEVKQFKRKCAAELNF